jgi:hypothetical protein
MVASIALGVDEGGDVLRLEPNLTANADGAKFPAGTESVDTAPADL